MAYLARGKKQDLVELAEVLDVVIKEDFKILEIKDAILKSPSYDEEFTKECLTRIINDRKELEQVAQKEKENELVFELEMLRLQTSTTSSKAELTVVYSSTDADMPRLELNKLLPNFDSKMDDMSLFLDLLEKQLTFLKVPVSKWVVYLVGLLPTEVDKLIAKESPENLLGSLPETPTRKKWIFIVEDTSTKWVELFSLHKASAVICAKTLLEEVILCYCLPRRLISDNGPQFVSAVMQQVCHLLGITQDTTPFYHPQANPCECKNRDLKPRLAILVCREHTAWEDKLVLIRFAMNTSICDTTGHTAAYLQFFRELRTTDDIVHDIREEINNDNFVPEITPYLRRFAKLTNEVKERVEQKQDKQKENYDRQRRQVFFSPGDKVWVTTQPRSNAGKNESLNLCRSVMVHM